MLRIASSLVLAPLAIAAAWFGEFFFITFWTIAAIINHAIKSGAKEVEVGKAAEDAWVELLLTGMGRMMGAANDCTPGYYNNEGRDPGPGAKYHVGYPQGAMAYFKYIDAWRASGAFEGLEFR